MMFFQNTTGQRMCLFCLPSIGGSIWLGSVESMAFWKVEVCSNNGCVAKVVKDGIEGYWLKKAPWSPLVRNGCIYKEILE